MGMNLTRSLVSAVVGAGSGGLDNVAPMKFGTTNVGWDVIEEAAATLVGVGMQLLMPFTLPDVADGLVDGGLALLAARGTRALLNQGPKVNAWGMSQGLGNEGYTYEPVMIGGSNGYEAAPDYRASLSGVSRLPKMTLS